MTVNRTNSFNPVESKGVTFGVQKQVNFYSHEDGKTIEKRVVKFGAKLKNLLDSDYAFKTTSAPYEERRKKFLGQHSLNFFRLNDMEQFPEHSLINRFRQLEHVKKTLFRLANLGEFEIHDLELDDFISIMDNITYKITILLEERGILVNNITDKETNYFNPEDLDELLPFYDPYILTEYSNEELLSHFESLKKLELKSRGPFFKKTVEQALKFYTNELEKRKVLSPKNTNVPQEILFLNNWNFLSKAAQKRQMDSFRQNFLNLRSIYQNDPRMDGENGEFATRVGKALQAYQAILLS